MSKEGSLNVKTLLTNTIPKPSQQTNLNLILEKYQ